MSIIGIHAKTIVWTDSTHIVATYDWTEDSQLLDWHATLNGSLTRGTGVLTVTSGGTGIRAARWSHPIAVSNLTAQARAAESQYVNIYTNLSVSWDGSPWNANPSLGTIHYYSTPLWVVNGGSYTFAGPSPTSFTWYDFQFESSTTLLRSYSSINSTWYERSGTYAPSTGGYVALGAYNATTNWGTVVLTGEVAWKATSITPSSLAAGAEAVNTVEFTAKTAIPNLGKVVITYPSGFDVSGADGLTAGSLSGLDGTWTASVAGQVITFTQTGGSETEAGNISFTISGVVNPETSGVTGAFALTTTTAAGTEVDADPAVAGITILTSETTSTGAALAGGAVSAGAVESGLAVTSNGASSAGGVTSAGTVVSGSAVAATGASAAGGPESAGEAVSGAAVAAVGASALGGAEAAGSAVSGSAVTATGASEIGGPTSAATATSGLAVTADGAAEAGGAESAGTVSTGEAVAAVGAASAGGATSSGTVVSGLAVTATAAAEAGGPTSSATAHVDAAEEVTATGSAAAGGATSAGSAVSGSAVSAIGAAVAGGPSATGVAISIGAAAVGTVHLSARPAGMASISAASARCAELVASAQP